MVILNQGVKPVSQHGLQWSSLLLSQQPVSSLQPSSNHRTKASDSWTLGHEESPHSGRWGLEKPFMTGIPTELTGGL